MAKEKKPIGFLKTTALGAVLVVVPVGIIGFALWQIVSLVRTLLLPIFESLPFDSDFTRVSVIAIALLSVVLICYLTGLAVRTRWGAAMRGWMERVLLERIPGYSIIRTLMHQYLGHEEERTFRPVLIDLYGSDSRAIGFEIEELGDGTVAVFLPSVPAATLGQVQIVPQKRVTPLKATMHETLEALTMFGVGSSKLVDADPETNP
ncbi:MAG: DUF502 domain-containing protein [Roseibacillus sp.]|jgi:uncharacterized membrane protein